MIGRQTVTLDLWLTLIAELDGTQRSHKRYETRAELAGKVLEQRGISVSKDALLDASQKISRLVTSDHDLGVDLDFTERVAQMLAIVDESLAQQLDEAALADVSAAVDQAFLDNPPNFLPGANEVLAQLGGLDLNVALISNTGLTSASAYREWFRREGVLDYFDELTFSNEIACAKPNPTIFNSTLESIGASPQQGIHIGDNLLTDISGAAGVGMRTGWIAGYDERDPIVEPDYRLESITDLPSVVDRWLASLHETF